MSQPEGIPTHHPSLGARGCPRTSPGADGRRKRADAPSFRHRRTSLRHAQMPRRLSPLPRARLRQGARRMEPDGALLQLYPRAQYPRLRGLRRLHGKAIPSALTRSQGRFKPHPARFGNLLDKYSALAPDQTLRPKSRRMTALLAQPRRVDLSQAVTFRFSELTLAAPPKSVVSVRRPVPLEGRFAIVTSAGRDAVDADGALRRGRRTRTAKSCGPDASAVGVKSVEATPPMTVSTKPDHRGEREISRKPLRGECRVNPVRPANACALCYYHCTRGYRAHRAPGIPRALFSEGAGPKSKTRAKSVLRDRESVSVAV